jgi:methanol:N,N-dimethyl-4-nitrosoaniline oxidoreductase
MLNKEMIEFPIVYTNPIPKIALGWGAYQTIGNECNAAGMKKALIVTSGLKGTGVIDEIKGVINYAGVATEIYDKITSNPKDWQIMEAYKVFKAAGCDGVVAVGGGSSIDTGKGVRIIAANGGKDISNFTVFLDPPWGEKVKSIKPCTVPQISVPTTAGTGAEVSSFAALNDTKNKMKVLASAPNIQSNIAIIDPVLARTMPRHVAAWTGFDAMAHGVEAFVTKVQGPYAYGMLLRCVELVYKNLREFAYNRNNHLACERMCWAATMGGIGIGFGAGAGLVHGLGHQISAVTDCHHGRVNAVMMLAAEEYNRPVISEKLAILARAMGKDTAGMTDYEAANCFFDAIEELLIDLEIPSGQLNKQFGLKETDLERIVDIYKNDFCSQGNPRDYNKEELVELLKSQL